jgi:AAA15 family ATPase/GTPase
MSKGGDRAMLLSFSVKGYKVFFDEVTFSMEADNYIQKNRDNIMYNDNKKISVVKTALLFGPNNTGKTCFLEAIEFFVSIVKAGKVPEDIDDYNIFLSERKMSFRIKFYEQSTIYEYELDLAADFVDNEILRMNDKLIFNRADLSSYNESMKSLNELIGGYRDRLFVLTLPEKEYGENVNDIRSFFNRFEFIFDFRFSKEERLGFMKDFLNPDYQKDILNIIKNADLLIDDVRIDERYAELLKNHSYSNDAIEENKICSVYTFKEKTKITSFFWYNSKGTIKTAFMAQRISNAIKNNKILVIDEIDGSLHTVLTKELINYFNSNHNTQAQLIATTQDLLLLDDRFLLRKDQIWFIYKDKEANYLYSLDNFKDNREVDARGNVLKRYLKGLFGALPLPSIIGNEDLNI